MSVRHSASSLDHALLLGRYWFSILEFYSQGENILSTGAPFCFS